jgi:hypothetical protein
LTAIFDWYSPWTAEELLAKRLGKLGPVIAIGRPGEPLPPLGAARFYVSHERWQEKVADVLRASQMVVWMTGVTKGLRWELDYLIKSTVPSQIIVWAHPHLIRRTTGGREAEWRSFRERLGDLFPLPLPELLGQTRFFHFGPEFAPLPVLANEYTLGSAEADAIRSLMVAKGFRRKPSWFWRSRKLLVTLPLGIIAGVLAMNVNSLLGMFWNAFWWPFAYFASPTFTFQFINGLWGVVFVLMQPLVARCFGGYLIGAALFGLVRSITSVVLFNQAWIYSRLQEGTPWLDILGQMLSVRLLFFGCLWGVLVAMLLRLLPYASGRPVRPIVA